MEAPTFENANKISHKKLHYILFYKNEIQNV